MIKLFNILTQRDKLLHFVVGIFMTAILSLFLDYYATFFIVLLVAFMKEIYDKQIKKTFIETLDIVMTLLGFFLVLIIKNT